jgi:hypothetical protein
MASRASCRAQGSSRHFLDRRGRAAELLGISRETLRYRIEKFDLRTPDRDEGGPR